MILASLHDRERYVHLHPLFRQLFDYVLTHDLTQVPAGRITLSGDDLFINVADAELRTREAQKLEVHRDYIDVHFPLSGDEVFGWTPLTEITVPSDEPFDTEHDFALYTAPAVTYMTVHPGQMAIVWPEDAHAPIIGCGTLRKAIAKVRIR